MTTVTLAIEASTKGRYITSEVEGEAFVLIKHHSKLWSWETRYKTAQYATDEDAGRGELEDEDLITSLWLDGKVDRLERTAKSFETALRDMRNCLHKAGYATKLHDENRPTWLGLDGVVDREAGWRPSWDEEDEHQTIGTRLLPEGWKKK